MEENLTEKIKVIINTPDEEVDVESAALILLKLNRNRTLYESICRRRNVDKLKYELQKIYSFRSNGESVEKTKSLEKEVVKLVKTTFPKQEEIEAAQTKGKRQDHDLLPDEIKAKLIENLNIFPKMRKLHEQLKLMNTALPCDRYPFLKELKELDEMLRKNWDEYDAFVIVTDTQENEGQKTEEKIAPQEPAFPDPKKISAARKYLSENKATLAGLKEQEEQSNYLMLRDKMQERMTFLIASGAGISDEQMEELKALGLDA
jgi:hypothetical protein